jgi:hypothetical protein
VEEALRRVKGLKTPEKTAAAAPSPARSNNSASPAKASPQARGKVRGPKENNPGATSRARKRKGGETQEENEVKKRVEGVPATVASAVASTTASEAVNPPLPPEEKEGVSLIARR